MRRLNRNPTSKWGKLSAASKLDAVLQDSILDAKAHLGHSQNYDTSQIASADAEFYAQGDLELHQSRTTWEKRMALRRHKLVLDALHRWWDCMLKSKVVTWNTVHSTTPRITGSAGTEVREATLGKRVYLDLQARFYQALVGRANSTEAQIEAEEAWKRDCPDGTELSRRQFQDSLFEMADIWSRGVDPAECAPF